MIASLPMYWRDENADLWRNFWRHVQAFGAEDGLALPDLTDPADLPADWLHHWLSPDLALSMTCGLPFRTSLKGRVDYVGTLDFGLNAAPGYYYSSVLRPVGAADTGGDIDGLTLAYNGPDSQSGWAVTKSPAPFATLPTFARKLCTGAHAASMAAVASGKADIAYVDAVSWRLLERYDPLSAGVRVVGTSVATPGLPLIAAKGADVTALRRVLRHATLAFAPEDPFAMGGPLSFLVLDPREYYDVPIPAPPA